MILCRKTSRGYWRGSARVPEANAAKDWPILESLISILDKEYSCDVVPHCFVTYSFIMVASSIMVVLNTST